MSDAPFFHESSGTVRFQVGQAGSAEPVMLREFDLQGAD